MKAAAQRGCKIAIVYPEVLDLARFKELRKEFPPFGPMYLAAVLEGAGHDVRMFKVDPSTEPLDFRGFDVVAFSVSASAAYGLMLNIRRESHFSDDTFVMVGGVHANFYPERTLIDFEADVVGIGEGEETILELVRAGRGGAFDRIPGVGFRADGGIRRTMARDMMKDIDVLPLPARHLMDPSDFIMTDRLSETDLRMAHVMLSRGCPFPCSFCASAHTKMQVRSGAHARAELVHLMEAYGIEGFAIVDDNFIVNKKKVAEICRAIGDLGLKWSALSRVDTVSPDLLAEMAAAGCVEIKYGVESGSEALLKHMRKNTTRQKIASAIRATKNAGINVKAFVIHGFPGENTDTTRETISLLDDLRGDIDRVSVFRFVPLPGTEAYRDAGRFGIRGTDQEPGWDGDWSKYHIHHNDAHWWGSDADFAELNASHGELTRFVDQLWPDRHAAPQEEPSAPRGALMSV